MNKKLIESEAKDYLGITLALVLYSFGFTFFLMPYEIVTGGVTGIGAIVYYATGFSNSTTYLIINALLLVVGLKILGVRFLMKTIYAILVLTFLLWLMKSIAPVDENGNMCGDVDFDAVEPIVSAITPVPGGVGGVTTSVLLSHVVDAAEKTL